MGILDDSGEKRKGIERKTAEVVRVAVAGVVATVSTFGYLELSDPTRFFNRIDPKEVQRIARPYAFTSKDGERLENRVERVEDTVGLLEKLMEKFLTTGPEMVRQNQERILEELREMRRQQEQHFREQKVFWRLPRRQGEKP